MFQIKNIDNPNCPTGTVTQVLIGETYRNLFNSFFENKQIEPIYVPDNPSVDESLKGHVDLSVFHAGNEALFISRSIKNADFVTKINNNCDISYVFGQKSTYPEDCNLNIAYNGSYLIFNIKTADKNIVSYLTKLDIANTVHVKQGYTKCSVCFVDDKSIITGDPGIAKACRNKGMDVLLIDDSFIKLDHFNKGFIGGSSFKPSQNELAFTGTIPDHKARNEIEEFLENKKIKAVYMREQTIIDVGGIIPITMK